MANQARADKVIEAIEEYQHDSGLYPEDLNSLLPSFITELPKTVKGDDFDYRRVDSLGGFYLCFEVNRRTGFGCCYGPLEYQWGCDFVYLDV